MFVIAIKNPKGFDAHKPNLADSHACENPGFSSNIEAEPHFLTKIRFRKPVFNKKSGFSGLETFRVWDRSLRCKIIA
jgi:hypothetical protein